MSLDGLERLRPELLMDIPDIHLSDFVDEEIDEVRPTADWPELKSASSLSSAIQRLRSFFWLNS